MQVKQCNVYMSEKTMAGQLTGDPIEIGVCQKEQIRGVFLEEKSSFACEVPHGGQ